MRRWLCIPIVLLAGPAFAKAPAGEQDKDGFKINS